MPRSGVGLSTGWLPKKVGGSEVVEGILGFLLGFNRLMLKNWMLFTRGRKVQIVSHCSNLFDYLKRAIVSFRQLLSTNIFGKHLSVRL